MLANGLAFRTEHESLDVLGLSDEIQVLLELASHRDRSVASQPVINVCN